MSKNRGVVYIKPGVVEVRDIPDPKFEDPHGRKINHAVILKIISPNICGCERSLDTMALSDHGNCLGECLLSDAKRTSLIRSLMSAK